MDLRDSIEKIQSYHDLRKFQDVFPDENIEFGLCRPSNEKLFLTASVAFLHKQLLRKLDDDADDSSNYSKFSESQTDLLLLENEFGREIYINVKNANKFEDVITNEARIPKNKLSLLQMIPKARKPKNTFTMFSTLLRRASNRSLAKKSKSSVSLSTKKKNKHDYNNYEDDDSLLNVPSAKIELFKKFFSSVPSYTSIISNNSSLHSRFSKPRSSASSLSLTSYSSSFTSSNISDATALSYLKNARFDGNTNVFTTTKFRRKIDRRLLQNENIFKIDEICYKTTSETTQFCRIKRQQSKLSVCMEENEDDSSDDDQTEIEEYPVKDVPNFNLPQNIINNFKRDFQVGINPRLLEVILAKVIKDMQQGNIV